MGERLFEELELAKLYEEFRLRYDNIGLEKEVQLFLSQSHSLLQRHKQKLQVFISNTYSPGRRYADEQHDDCIPSWEMRLEGRAHHPDHNATGYQQKKFSSFFKRIEIELDKDLYGPDNHLIEWHRIGATNETDGFQVKRPGSDNFKCTIRLWFNPEPPQYKVDPSLAGLLGSYAQNQHVIITALWKHIRNQDPMNPQETGYANNDNSLQQQVPQLVSLLGEHTLTQDDIIAALQQYIKTNNLQDPKEEEYVNNDNSLKQIFDCQRMKFSEIPEHLQPMLHLPDPVVMDYVIDCNINNKKTERYDLDVHVVHSSCAVDVGCGTGLLTRILAPYFSNVIGVDISEAQIQVARDVTKDANVEYRVGPAEDLSFLENESVELVTAAACVHYFDTDHFFEEVDRVLKPGGCLAIITNGRSTEAFSLTPVTENIEIIQKCNSLMKEVLSFSLNQFGESSRNILSDGHPEPKNYVEVHRFTLTTKKEGNIDILVGLLNSFGVFWKHRQENPGDDTAGQFRKRFLDIFCEISDTPEEVQVILASPLHCSLYRKPGL